MQVERGRRIPPMWPDIDDDPPAVRDARVLRALVAQTAAAVEAFIAAYDQALRGKAPLPPEARKAMADVIFALDQGCWHYAPEEPTERQSKA